MVTNSHLRRLAVQTLRRDGPGQAFADIAAVLRARWQLRNTKHASTVRLKGRVMVVNHGNITIGEHVRLDGTTVRIELACFGDASLNIGANTFINYGTNISATNRVSIGRDCAIGQYCIVMDDDYHQVGALWQPGKSAPVEIGDSVWLSARVIVLAGSRIGSRSVIAANSVVRGEIPPSVVASGIPARVIREIDAPPEPGE